MSIENWLIKLINKYRNIVNDYSDKIRKQLALDDFGPKCQLELLQFSDPDWQILIVTHFDDEDDLLIKIHDKVPIADLVNTLQQNLTNTRWDKYVSFEEVSELYNRRDEADMHFRRYLEFNYEEICKDRNNFFAKKNNKKTSVKVKSKIISTSRSRDFYWLIHGDL